MSGRTGGSVDETPRMPKGRPLPTRGVNPGSGRESVLASASTWGGAEGWGQPGCDVFVPASACSYRWAGRRPLAGCRVCRGCPGCSAAAAAAAQPWAPAAADGDRTCPVRPASRLEASPQHVSLTNLLGCLRACAGAAPAAPAPAHPQEADRGPKVHHLADARLLARVRHLDVLVHCGRGRGQADGLCWPSRAHVGGGAGEPSRAAALHAGEPRLVMRVPRAGRDSQIRAAPHLRSCPQR